MEAELAEQNFIKETGDRIVTGKFVKRDVGKIVYFNNGTSSDNRCPKNVPRLEDHLYGKYSKDIDPQSEKDVEEKMLSWIKQKGLITEDLFNVKWTPVRCPRREARLRSSSPLPPPLRTPLLDPPLLPHISREIQPAIGSRLLPHCREW